MPAALMGNRGVKVFHHYLGICLRSVHFHSRLANRYIQRLDHVTSGQSYKASTIVIYNSRVVPDLKIPHITTLES